MALQIKGKFLEDASIDGEKLKLTSGQAVKLVKADGVTEVRLIEIDEATGKIKLGEVVAALQPDLEAEISRAETKEAELESALNAEIAARAAADTQLSTATQSAIQAEANARVAGDASTLQAAKDYVNDIVGVTDGDALEAFASLQAAMSDGEAATGVLTALNSVKEALDQEVTDRTADVNAEEARAVARENAIESALNAEVSRATTKEAEIEAALSSEITRAGVAESDLSDRVEVLELRLHRKKKIVISAADIANGFILLDHKAMSKSIVASVGRLMIHEADEVPGQAVAAYSDDFFVDNSGSVSKLVFVGNLVSPSEEQLEEGDILYVKYMNV